MKRKQLTYIVSWSVLVFAIFLFLILSFGYFGEYSRFLDVLSNFKIQIFQASLLFMIIALFLKITRKIKIANIAILGIILLITFMEMLPWYFFSNKGNKTGKTFRISLVNVLKNNNHYGDVLNFVNNISPDLLVFMEIDEKWFKQLLPLDPQYCSKIVSSKLGNDGIIIYSKFPVVSSNEITLSPKGRQNFKITLDIEGQKIDCLVAHPVSPTRKPGKWEDRNTHIDNLGKLANSAENPVLIVADLNTSMWSPFYKKLIADTGLRNSRKGFGLHCTYPAPFALISGIPIDHILIDTNFYCTKFKTGPYIGSDHLPTYADIQFSIK